jgi:hypothetical protein
MWERMNGAEEAKQEERALSDIKSALHRVTPLPSARAGVRLLRPQIATG